MSVVFVTYWCHDCNAWEEADGTDGDYRCRICGETILCDECGTPYSADHYGDASTHRTTP